MMPHSGEQTFSKKIIYLKISTQNSFSYLVSNDSASGYGSDVVPDVGDDSGEWVTGWWLSLSGGVCWCGSTLN